MTFHFSRDDCLKLEKALKSEWLETNGLGGYASSTILGCHTRKYHGLLVVPLPEYNDKFVLLSKMGGVIRIADKAFHLSTNKFPGVFHPTGHKYIDDFEYDTHPKTTYRIADIKFVRDIIMPQNENTIIFKYKLVKSEKEITFHLNPKMAFRGIHSLSKENIDLQGRTYVLDNNAFKVEPYHGMPALYFDTSSKMMLHPGPYWIKSYEYLKERTRGFDYQEDLFALGVFEIKMKEGDELYFRASISEPKDNIKTVYNNELKRRQKNKKALSKQSISLRTLKNQAEKYIIKNPRDELSIIAGYHWFGEWGRDAMIALPGLTLYCDKPDQAFEILKTYARHEKNGLVPNYLSLAGDDHAYNSVDASLWFFWAVQEYLKKTKNTKKVLTELFNTLEKIITSFAQNKVENVWVTEKGLIWVGNENTQLTWMDAQAYGKPVTPRHGYAVELNALWFNALSFYKELCCTAKKDFPKDIEQILIKVRESYTEVFWHNDYEQLVDVVNDNGADTAVRPNQIFAVSLPYSPLDVEKQKKVVQIVHDHLVTPYGLRSLSPRNAKYQAEYIGNPNKRDAAYHQGTVWSWLVGPYVEASLKVAKNKKEEADKLQKIFSHLWHSHFRVGCLGGVSEIFNGDPPHEHKGAIGQAWGVAESIRAITLIEEA